MILAVITVITIRPVRHGTLRYGTLPYRYVVLWRASLQNDTSKKYVYVRTYVGQKV